MQPRWVDSAALFHNLSIVRPSINASLLWSRVTSHPMSSTAFWESCAFVHYPWAAHSRRLCFDTTQCIPTTLTLQTLLLSSVDYFHILVCIVLYFTQYPVCLGKLSAVSTVIGCIQ